MSIGWKLNLGFGLLIALSLAIVIFNAVGGYQVTQNINRTSDLRIPAALAAAQAQTNLLKMVTDVHSYLTLNSLYDIADYYAAQRAFETNLAELERLMLASNAAEQTRQLAEFKTTFTTWLSLSEQMFALHNNPRLNQAGLYRYQTEVQPLSDVILELSSGLIQLQKAREPSPETNALLADMVDFQTSFDAMMTNLHGYALVGDVSFRNEYMARLVLNTDAWANLRNNESALTAAQQARLDNLAEARAAVLGLPLQIFDIVQSEYAYEDLYLYHTQSAPEAEAMLKALEQMTAAQQALLQTDLTQSRASLAYAILQSLGGSLLGLLLAIGMAITFRNTVVRSIQRLTVTAEQIAGGDFQVHASIETVDEIGQLAKAFNVMTDRLRHSIANLEKQTQQLEAMKAVAEASSRAKSEFLANMSHELRTPLNGILGYAQILSRDETLSPSQTQGISIIRSSGEHLLTLISDILDLSKIEARKIELYPDDFRLPPFLAGIVDMFQIGTLQKKSLAFIYEPMTPLPPVIKADQKRLRQILINLIGNAIKFTDQGEVRLRIGLIDPETGIFGVPPASSSETPPVEHFRFEVIDTGIGIHADRLEQIFLPFEQVSDPGHRAEGAGLGLTISRNLAEAMNGHLTVESELGQGSTFRLDLAFPTLWVGNAHQPFAFGGPIIGYAGPRRKLLVVDDEALNRSILVDLLEPLGFDILQAENSRQAIARACADQPDAILLDLLMPDLNGLEAVRQIRQTPELNGAKRTIIIATSAEAFDTDMAQSLAAGCDAFLAKPVDMGKLFALLASQLKLTWISREPPARTRVSPEPLDQYLVPPPPAEMAVLHDLITKGELPRLRQRALRIEQMGEAYHPFAAKLRQLAEKFDEDEILALIERYLDTESHQNRSEG